MVMGHFSTHCINVLSDAMRMLGSDGSSRHLGISVFVINLKYVELDRISAMLLEIPQHLREKNYSNKNIGEYKLRHAKFKMFWGHKIEPGRKSEFSTVLVVVSRKTAVFLFRKGNLSGVVEQKHISDLYSKGQLLYPRTKKKTVIDLRS